MALWTLRSFAIFVADLGAEMGRSARFKAFYESPMVDLDSEVHGDEDDVRAALTADQQGIGSGSDLDGMRHPKPQRTTPPSGALFADGVLRDEAARSARSHTPGGLRHLRTSEEFADAVTCSSRAPG
ncbi:MAG: hypothetical protein ACRDTT_09040 [Pseudonocardiaceae bacterium]